ncbi:uncharacterized protein BJ171DRAFT_511307 [Polychytrium aggregatum]|uniref:uncharacterized protein n=1 Tax=Polychytrium aggregatum TaxID=110093 RepID=UPI0022FE6BFA|nr:uncharacterized protein BJ171DRAFT_511307 [Polychytrium aggregatum]KAI9202921.1 hypothetical protein BJ171DRAFT_511307 [Polychytrium aggregatum]
MVRLHWAAGALALPILAQMAAAQVVPASSVKPTSAVVSSSTTVSSSAPVSSSSATTTTTTTTTTTATTTTTTASVTGQRSTGSATSSATGSLTSGTLPPISTSTPVASTGPNLPVIIGSVAGGLVGLAVIVALISWIVRRNRAKESAKQTSLTMDVELPVSSNAWKPLENQGQSYATPSQNQYQYNNGYVSQRDTRESYIAPGRVPGAATLNDQVPRDESPRRFASLNRKPQNNTLPAYTTIDPSSTRTTKDYRTVRLTRPAEQPDELDISAHQVLLILEEYEDGWGYAETEKGKRGVIPLNFLTSKVEPTNANVSENIPPVIPMPMPPVQSSSPAPALPAGVADYRIVYVGHNATQSDELTIVPNERVLVLERYVDGWGLVQNDRGQRGVVPLNFLA